MKKTEAVIPADYRWNQLVEKEGTELKDFYQQLLLDLGKSEHSQLRLIYSDSSTSITEPKKFREDR